MNISPLKKVLPLLALTLPALMLAGCSDNNSDDQKFTEAAVIAARASDYTSGAVSLVNINAPRIPQNDLNPSDSDIFVRSGGDFFLRIERFGIDRITRFEADAPQTATYTYSTQDATDGTNSSNPSDLIIVSDTKAYLLRYGSGKLWIVNPSATSEATFKTGEIDLSGYDSFDGIPEMTAGLLKDGKLYVAMQRLESFKAVKDSYVAVIDVATNNEIATSAATSGLKGIDVPLHNISSLAAIPGSNKILAVAAGGYGGAPSYAPLYDGGLVSIDTSNYAATLRLDDGDSTTHPYGQFGDVVAVSSDRAYLIGSAGFVGKETLYRFDPSSSTPAPVAVTGFSGEELGTLAVDPNGNLWVGRTAAAAPGFSVLGFSGGAETTIEDRINTNLIPINIDFISVPDSGT